MCARLLALLVLLTLACEGGEQPAPPSPAATTTPSVTASPDATATPAPAATPEPVTPAATATATPAATVAPTATATPSPTPTPTPTPTPVPTPPAVTVTGPLLVFSERVGVEETADDREIELRQVILYDVTADRYWTPLEYRTVRGGETSTSPVQPAGARLIVSSDGQVRRVGLDGTTERILLDHDRVREIMTSPDATKVAVSLSGYTLLVLDAATGEELLRVSTSHPVLGPLRARGWTLGSWRADGDALSLRGEYPPETAIVALVGDVRMLPEGWRVSPDLRYAVQVGEVIEWSAHAPVWGGLEVIDVETGSVVWTIADDRKLQGPWPSVSWWPDGSRYVAFRVLPAETHELLDTATGAVLRLTENLRRRLEGGVRSTCAVTYVYAIFPQHCDIRYNGRVIWEGARSWTHYLGLIDAVGDLEVRGIVPIDAVVKPDPPPPPLRREMEGPLLLYEVHRAHPTVPRLAIAYDEGTGRSWALHRRERDAYCSPPQAANGGLVTCSESEVLYIAADGQTKTLVPAAIYPTYRVSPDGQMVAVEINSDVFVLSIPSGDEILRVASASTYEAFARPGQERYSGYVWLAPWGANGWSVGGTALVTWISIGGHMEIPGAVLTLDGGIVPLPLDVAADGSNLSPDTRYIVRGRAKDSEEYAAWNWRSFDIIDFETERVLWSLETENSLQDYHWEWASADQFAWSSGAWPNLFRFDVQRLEREAERADISVLDITTGEIEVMDSADYLARFHPPPRATTECPEHPAQPCKILLDGEVVGEGRWPRIIGFIELD